MEGGLFAGDRKLASFILLWEKRERKKEIRTRLASGSCSFLFEIMIALVSFLPNFFLLSSLPSPALL